MKRLKLKKAMLFCYKGIYTSYKKGDIFELKEKKEMPIIGVCYKVAYKGITFDGWTRSDIFEVLK